jgi:uncharacterized protein with HEPN domain
MSRDPLLYLEDISNACDKILRFTSGIGREDFINDDKTYDAVLRNLEIGAVFFFGLGCLVHIPQISS